MKFVRLITIFIAIPYLAACMIHYSVDAQILMSKQNRSVYNDKLISFSHPGGIYESEFYLKLSTSVRGAKIFFTTDCNAPLSSEASTIEYTGPIKIYNTSSEPNRISNRVYVERRFNPEYKAPGNLMKGTIIRAVLQYENGDISPIETRTYIVRKNTSAYFKIPTISLVCPPEDFIGDENGIYKNFHNDDTYRTIMNVEYFGNDRKSVFSYDAEVKVFGGFTRNFGQKSLTLNFNRGETKNKIKYPIFGHYATDMNGETLDSFERLRLHSGGNDSKLTNFSEGLIHRLSKDMRAGTTAYSPVITFIDGEYWGLYSLREHYTSDYFKKHYGVNKDNIILLEFIWGCNNEPNISEGTEEDIVLYEEMYNYVRDNDMSDLKAYMIFVNKYMDIDSFIDCYIANIYFNNKDWPGNNNKFWRVRNIQQGNPYADGKWRYLIHDVDAGMQDVNFDIIAHLLNKNFIGAFAPEANARWSTLFFRKLVKNEEFFNRFLDRLLYHINYTYEKNKVAQMVDNFKSMLEPYIYHQKTRWNLQDQYPWYSQVAERKTFASLRARKLMDTLSSHFDLDAVTKITFEGIDRSNMLDIGFGEEVFSVSKQERYSIHTYINREVTIHNRSPYSKGFEISDGKSTKYYGGNRINISADDPALTVRVLYDTPFYISWRTAVVVLTLILFCAGFIYAFVKHERKRLVR